MKTTFNKINFVNILNKYVVIRIRFYGDINIKLKNSNNKMIRI
jgi:hypothetical protein